MKNIKGKIRYMENLYDIIGVSPSVSDEELDSAYKNTARSVFRTVLREKKLPTSWKSWNALTAKSSAPVPNTNLTVRIRSRLTPQSKKCSKTAT